MRQHHYLALGPAGFHRVAYTEWGEADNPRVLVCVHGLTRNGRDFAQLAEAELGVYPQMTGAAAQNANDQAITVSPEAKAFVLDWLQTDYGVSF